MNIAQPTATRHREPNADEMRRIEDEPSVEFVDGEIVEQAMGTEAVRIGGNIIALLKAADGDRSVAVYQDGLAYRCFADDAKKFRKPDVSLIAKSRLVAAGLVGNIGVMTIPPDLGVEVVSPGDLAFTVQRKLSDYRAAKFGQVWLVYPELHGIFVWRSDGYVADLEGDDELTAGPILPAFRCKVSAVFED